jgi:rRNA biogenesis protein RRP5
VYLSLLPKFAALEFRSPHGDREQGRTLFESLLAAYPRKFDLWNQLLDLETSPSSLSSSPAAAADQAVVVRDLFERGSKVKGLKPRQAKAWFRRWAKWEEEHGDAKSRERVSAKAVEWARLASERKGAAEVAAAAAAAAAGAAQGEEEGEEDEA